LDSQDLSLSKKLITTYKDRLENEIIKKSNKLKIPKDVSTAIIENNNEINNLRKALETIESETIRLQKPEG
tara:strand:+ start:152 stop:364 length:213 start_codon:yes stop_codon:yes gene_type:complete